MRSRRARRCLGDDTELDAAARPATDNLAAIETNVTGLGMMQLQQNGQPFTLGTPLKINPSTPPTLQAVPVKASDASLSEGTFSAWCNITGGLPMSLKRIFHCAAALAAVLLTPNVQAADNLHLDGNLLSKSGTLVVQGEVLADSGISPTVSRRDLMVTGQSARVPVVFQLKDCKGPAQYEVRVTLTGTEDSEAARFSGAGCRFDSTRCGDWHGKDRRHCCANQQYQRGDICAEQRQQ